MAYVRHQAALAAVPAGATTSNATLLAATAKRGGLAAELAREALVGPPLPARVAHVWPWYLELAASRGGTLAPAPISFGEIRAWSQLTGVVPSPYDVRLLQACDQAARSAAA